jgi:hypothetical protein
MSMPVHVSLATHVPSHPSALDFPHDLTLLVAAEHVEHAVVRRSEAHSPARGGGRAGGGERRPGVGCRAEAVEVVEQEAACSGCRGRACYGVRHWYALYKSDARAVSRTAPFLGVPTESHHPSD